MNYKDLSIEVTEQSVVERSRHVARYRVRLIEDMEASEAVDVEWDTRELQKTLTALERRELNRDGLISLGKRLADLLLPTREVRGKGSIRELFSRRLSKVEGMGVRLRLRLPRELAMIPWEYTYVERALGDGIDGFLALDAHVAMVRHEVLGDAPIQATLDGELRVVAALASAEGLPELDMDQELAEMTATFGGMSGVSFQPVMRATRSLVRPILKDAAIFHFAGHGDFTQVMGVLPGTYDGSGSLAFEDATLRPDELAVTLQGNGIRLAVLSACKTGRRDGVSIWSGVAPALVKVGIPAVVANQYTIMDTSAGAFSASFYRALADGLSTEEAVSAGRKAIFSCDTSGRDWGVPVLYLSGSGGPLVTRDRLTKAPRIADWPRLEVLCDRTREEDSFKEVAIDWRDTNRPPAWLVYGRRNAVPCEFFYRLEKFTLRRSPYAEESPIAIPLHLHDYVVDSDDAIRRQILDQATGVLRVPEVKTYEELGTRLRGKKHRMAFLYSEVYAETDPQARDWVRHFEQISADITDMSAKNGRQIIFVLGICYPEPRPRWPAWFWPKAADTFEDRFLGVFSALKPTCFKTGPLKSATPGDVHAWCVRPEVRDRIAHRKRDEIMEPFNGHPELPMATVMPHLKRCLDTYPTLETTNR